jgi:peroxiredoxin
MPKNKEIYAKYKDRGVEFIGVSLDHTEANGGLKKLKDFVAEQGIAWPQYYQGNYVLSEFSGSWGIKSIPTMFIVDADGKLASTDARENLEQKITELLAKREGKAAAAN